MSMYMGEFGSSSFTQHRVDAYRVANIERLGGAGACQRDCLLWNALEGRFASRQAARLHAQLIPLRINRMPSYKGGVYYDLVEQGCVICIHDHKQSWIYIHIQITYVSIYYRQLEIYGSL